MIAACQKLRSRRRTDRLDIKATERGPFCRELIEIRCLNSCIPVQAEIAPTKVVGNYHQDIGVDIIGVSHTRDPERKQRGRSTADDRGFAHSN